MALTEIYVDPSIAADSGAGTIGDPYGDLEYAIEQETFDATNGTRVNIKAGTDEILAAALNAALDDTSVSIAWSPGATSHLVFQGYTSAAGDGGIGGISGGGSVGIVTGASKNWTDFVDLHLHNCGSAAVLDLNNIVSVLRCEVDNTTGSGVMVDASGIVSECYVHNVGATSIAFGGGDGIASYNHIVGGVNDFQFGIAMFAGLAYRNIIETTSASSGQGINITGDGSVIENSIYGAGSASGHGMDIGTGLRSGIIANNLVEGFSGSSGIGIATGGAVVPVFVGNAVYDCETEYEAPLLANLEDDNETLSASPFTSAGTGDFSPVDTGNVKEGALPQVIGGGLV